MEHKNNVKIGEWCCLCDKHIGPVCGGTCEHLLNSLCVSMRVHSLTS